MATHADAGPVAVPWRTRGDAEPLVCWSDAQLAALAGGIDAVLAAWAAAWGLQASPAVTVAAAAPVAELAGWRSLQREAAPGGWLQVESPLHDGLARSLFPGGATSGRLAAAVATACEQDALRRLLAPPGLAAGASCDAPSPAACGPWSGAVAVRLAPPLAWQLVLPAPVVAAWCELAGLMAAPANMPRSPLASLLEALAQQPIPLDIRLDGCELDVGSLQALRPGDIVCMEHPIEAPASVTDRAGEPLFRAYLGRRDGLKAVELAAPAAAAAAPALHEDLP